MNRKSNAWWGLLTVAILLVGMPALAADRLSFSKPTEGEPGAANFEGPAPTSHVTETVISLGVDPVGTFTEPSVTFDCASCYLGFGTERWDFTVTAPTDITVEVNDCCVEGDRFEARCNNRSLDEDGDTDLNNHEEDCIFGREDTNVPVGTYASLGTVTLDPGDWTVRIRDIQFQCGTVNPGCGAGYTMRITFGPPSGTTCAGIASCFDPGNPFGLPDSCRDHSLPRDEPMDMIEAKLDGLEPQIVALEQKLDLLQIQVEEVLIALEVIEAKLDDPGPGPCDLSDPLTCDGTCPIAGDVCTPGVGGAPCSCVTPCDQSDPLTCDGVCPTPTDVCTVGPALCTCETPCDLSDPGTCDGVCPLPTEACFSIPGIDCFCEELCDLSDPLTCGGLCPDPTDVCTPSQTVPPGPCTCEPPPGPCDTSDPMTCGGTCPGADEICTIDPAGGPCECKLPCDLSDPATCDGLCPDPTSQVCVSDPLTQQCVCDPIPTDFCRDAVGNCFACVAGTTCPDGTLCGPITGCP